MNYISCVILLVIFVNFMIMFVKKGGFAHPYLLIFIGLSFLLSLFYNEIYALHALTFMFFFIGDTIFSNYLKKYSLGILFFFGAHFAYGTLLSKNGMIDYYIIGYGVFCGIFLYLSSKFYFRKIMDLKLRLMMMLYVMIASFPISISLVNLMLDRTGMNWIIATGSVFLTITDNFVAYNLVDGVDRKNLTWAFYVPAILCWNIGPYL